MEDQSDYLYLFITSKINLNFKSLGALICIFARGLISLYQYQWINRVTQKDRTQKQLLRYIFS